MGKLLVRNISNAILPLRDVGFAILPSKVVDLCQIFNDSDVKGLLKRPDISRLLETGRIVVVEMDDNVRIPEVVDKKESELNQVFSDPENQPPQFNLDDMTTAELKALCKEKDMKPYNSRKKILEILRGEGEDE